MSAPPAADATAFRRLMGRWATGVSVVTAREGERDFGLTVNAFLSVSLAPPTVLVSLGHEADTTPVVARTCRFAVSVLSHEQRSVSEKFARTSTPEVKFQGSGFHRTPSGLAILDGALGTFDAKVTKTLEVGDHTLFAGVVEHVTAGPEAAPLLFFRSQYAEPAGADLVRLPRPKP
ncbi:MAG TPA: flavin reductase family protein [Thermoplasmata archaeon]|nr:flavin reductase family protein [Thermoplasmata archaeon]